MTIRQPAVYILANAPRGTLYAGVTGWLRHRIHEHREGLVDGFTKRHGLKTLVWFEWHADFDSAIRREKQIKKMESDLEARTHRESESAMAGPLA